MGVKSALSSVLSFFLEEEEASGSDLGEMRERDLERRLEDIVRERERGKERPEERKSGKNGGEVKKEREKMHFIVSEKIENGK